LYQQYHRANIASWFSHLLLWAFVSRVIRRLATRRAFSRAVPIRWPAGKLAAAIPVPLWSTTVKNVLAVVFVVFVASIALSQNAKPPAQVKGDGVILDPAAPGGVAPAPGPPPGPVPVKTQKWEYKVSDRGGFEPGDWQKKLNDLAKEGWELNVVDEGHYILRRPVLIVVPAVPVFRPL
jgi:hypothetical protein